MEAVKMEHPYIVRRESVLGAQPTIEGSRISVAAVARFLNNGVPVDEIISTFAHVKPAVIYDAISFYLDHREEIDEIIFQSTPEALAARGYLVVVHFGQN